MLGVLRAGPSEKRRITLRVDGFDAFVAPDAFVAQIGRPVVFSGLFAVPDGEGVLVAAEVIEDGHAALLTFETRSSAVLE
jgi:hypothetical protein